MIKPWTKDLLDKRFEARRGEDVRLTDYGYSYPGDNDFRPGSELTDFLCSQVNAMATSGMSLTNRLATEFQRMNWTLSAFMPPDQAEANIRKRDWRKPVCITVPATFAAREVFLTYLTSAFIKDPIDTLVGIGDIRAKIGGMCFERVQYKQDQWFKTPLHLTTQWQDALAYGIGAVALEWRKHRAKRVVEKEVSELVYAMLRGDGVKLGQIERYLEDDILFEGNQYVPIDPQAIILDPNVTPNFAQDARFIGWFWTTDANAIISRETDPEEGFFNGKALKSLALQKSTTSAIWTPNATGRETRYNLQSVDRTYDSNSNIESPVTCCTLMMNLIPYDWGLGKSTEVQKWIFTVAGDKLVIQAQQMDYAHGMYPISIVAPSTNGHDVFPVSYLATTIGLQKAIDFELNTKMLFEIRALNGDTIVDPSKVRWDDVMRNDGPGKVIRLMEDAYGQGIDLKAYYQQIPMQNVTEGNTASALILTDMLRQGLGTTDITMGDLSGMPERPGVAGVNAATSGSLSRLQRIAMMMAYQSMDELAWMKAENTRQFMSEKVFAKMTDNMVHERLTEYGYDVQGEHINISPFDLPLNYEINTHHGAIPQMENVNAWTTIVQSLLQSSPEAVTDLLSKMGGMFGVFSHWARISGATDFQEFVKSGALNNIQVKSAPDVQVSEQADSGQLVPLQALGPQ